MVDHAGLTCDLRVGVYMVVESYVRLREVANRVFMRYNRAMKKIWAHKANSFKEAAEFDSAYYMKMSKAERISTMQFLREMHTKFTKRANEKKPRLKKIIRVRDMEK